MKKKVIIDCDTGVDDAQAIALAFLSEDVEILAITCVAGNVSVEQAAKNTVRVLYELDACHIPVYLGCETSLMNVPSADAKEYHGSDGLGNAPHATSGEPPYDQVIQSEKAALAICRIIKENPGEITIVALAPLTNIALAFRLDSRVITLTKEIFIMGGAVHSKGNVTVVAEFNISTDPEAAAIVLESTVCPTYLMPWETIIQTGADWDWHTNWMSTDHKVMRFLKETSAHTIDMDKRVWNVPFCPPDLVTMAWVLDCQLSTKSSVHHCYLDCGTNPLTRGHLIVDWRGILKGRKNITVCLDWSADVFKQLLDKMVVHLK